MQCCSVHVLAMVSSVAGFCVCTCLMLQSCMVVTLQDGRTALHWAALRGHTAALKVLVAAGAGLNVADLVSYM